MHLWKTTSSIRVWQFALDIGTKWQCPNCKVKYEHKKAYKLCQCGILTFAHYFLCGLHHPFTQEIPVIDHAALSYLYVCTSRHNLQGLHPCNAAPAVAHLAFRKQFSTETLGAERECGPPFATHWDFDVTDFSVICLLVLILSSSRQSVHGGYTHGRWS